MSDNFTPGPWKVTTGTSSLFVITEDGRDICDPYKGAKSQGEFEANARLIAAAPDLLKACRKLANEAAGFLALSDVERHGMTNSRILRDRIEQARDVIRKAEGQ